MKTTTVPVVGKALAMHKKYPPFAILKAGSPTAKKQKEESSSET